MELTQGFNEENLKGSNRMKAVLTPWLVCFAATLIFFYEFIQGNMFASIASDVMRDFNIKADSMAYLSSIYYLSNVLFLFVSGIILDRFSIKLTILCAMFLCVLSTFIMAISHDYSTALLCRFIAGIGSAFCFLGPVRLAAQWFPPQRMAMVTGLIVTMAMTGGLLAQYPMAALVAQIGWRPAVNDVGYLGLIMLLFMMWGIEEKPGTQQKNHLQPLGVMTAAKLAYFNGQYLRAALSTSLMNMAIAVFGAMMGTLYLEQRLGISTEEASVINGMLFVGAIIGGPLMGWISDKMSLRVLPMKYGVIASLATTLIILYVPVTPAMMKVLFFMLGLLTSAQVISYALIAESSPAAITATAVSVGSILTQGGAFIYQNLFGLMLTHHGDAHMIDGSPVYSLASYQYAALILPLGLVLAFLALLGLKETYCKKQED